MTVFFTQATAATIGIVNGFVLARVLGPSAKGDFYLLTLVPETLMVLLQLGLPQAFGFFAARGQTLGINAKTVTLALALALPTLAVTIALLPVLQESIFDDLASAEIILPLLALPLILNGSFTLNVIIGRRQVTWYSAVSIGGSLVGLVLYVVLVGVLGLGLRGALVAYLLLALVQATARLVASVAAERRNRDPGRLTYRQLFRYGLPFYPGSLTQYYSYRADIYLIAWLLVDASAALGFYSMAVSMAELVFFVPNAVSTTFFPHVAESTREEADRMVPTVARVTILASAAAALALVPAAVILISVLLPAFRPSLPALFVLLPGVVALSNTKVLRGYVSGLGRTGLTSIVAIAAFALNIVVNLILIPRYGIIGAAFASLISYSASSIAYSVIAARLSKARLRDFWLPRPSDVRFTVQTLVGLGGRMWQAARRRH